MCHGDTWLDGHRSANAIRVEEDDRWGRETRRVTAQTRMRTGRARGGSACLRKPSLRSSGPPGPDGYCDYQNRRWFDYSGMTAESSGTGWLAAVHPDDRDRCSPSWPAIRKTAKGFEFEYRLRRQDGVYRWFLAQAGPICDDEEQVVRWFGTCTRTSTTGKHHEDAKLRESGTGSGWLPRRPGWATGTGIFSPTELPGRRVWPRSWAPLRKRSATRSRASRRRYIPTITTESPRS